MAETGSENAAPSSPRPAAWRGSGFLFLGGATALLALPLAALVSVGVITTVVLIGGLLLAVVVPTARWLARAQRRRVGRWTGRSVPELYSSAGGTIATRVEAMLRDPATWRDLLWLWLMFPVGMFGLVLCWVPFLAGRLASQQAGMSRRLLSPTARAVRRHAERQAMGEASGSARALPGAHGLLGMQERVAVLGGTVKAGPLGDGGFEVLVELPLPAENGNEPASPGSIDDLEHDQQPDRDGRVGP